MGYSPDRADALVLCFCEYWPPSEKRINIQADDKSNRITSNDLVKEMGARKFEGFKIEEGNNNIEHLRGRDLIGIRGDRLSELLRGLK
jgi:hypothetical protein